MFGTLSGVSGRSLLAPTNCTKSSPLPKARSNGGSLFAAREDIACVFMLPGTIFTLIPVFCLKVSAISWPQTVMNEPPLIGTTSSLPWARSEVEPR